MRIAYLLADHGIPLFGNKGAAVHVVDLIGALTALDQEVVLYCARHGGPQRPLPWHWEKVTAPTPAEASGAGDDPRAARRHKERCYLALAEALEARVAAAHRQRPFDALYERYSLWSAAGVRLARRLGLPLVLEVNAPLLAEQRRYRELALDEAAAAIEAEVFGGADHILAVSQGVADYVIAHGARPERVQVLPNGVDAARFHPAVTPAALPEAEGRFVIGFAGSLKAWHGVEILLDAFRELTRRLAGLHLLLIGDGPLRAWVDGYVAGAGVGDNVTCTGWVAHDAIPPLLARADVLSAPYPPLDDFYFSPLKLFEYLALGKPVVASRIGQIEEVIEHGRDGLLVPPGDAWALAEALQRLCVDEPLRRRLGQGARVAARGYTWHRNAQRIVALLQGATRRAVPLEAGS